MCEYVGLCVYGNKKFDKRRLLGAFNVNRYGLLDHSHWKFSHSVWSDLFALGVVLPTSMLESVHNFAAELNLQEPTLHLISCEGIFTPPFNNRPLT